MKLNPGFDLVKVKNRYFPLLDRHREIQELVVTAATMQPFNYYHFMTDFVIPFIAYSEIGDIPLFIPFRLSKIQKEILIYHKIAFIQTNFQCNTTLESAIWLPSIFNGESGPDSFFSEYGLNKMIVNRANTERLRPTSRKKEGSNPRRIFVSRKGVSRAPDNLDTVEELFKLNGFSIFNSQDISPIEAIELFQSSHLIVGNHGAGLTNLIYMPQGSTVIELSGGNFKFGDKARPVFSNLSEALELKHLMYTAPIDIEGWKQLITQICEL